MSTNLFWRPVVERKGQSLSKELKYALSRRYFDHDGSLSSDFVQVGQTDIAYLTGLRDGGVADAEKLLEALEKHPMVEIWIAE